MWIAALACLVLAACAFPRQGEPQEGTMLSGTVTYRPRIALPPDATVHVRVLEVSRAGATGTTIAEETIATERRQVPIPFSLVVDRDRVDPANRLVVRAEIRDGDGRVRWTTGTAQEVPASGPLPDSIEIVVVQVGPAGTGATALVGPTWQLARIGTADGRDLRPGADERYTISFDPEGRFTGQAHCNRYAGDYTASSSGTLELRRGLSTLAACAPPSVANEFMDVLNGIVRFTLSGDTLTLSADSGGALVFQRSGGE